MLVLEEDFCSDIWCQSKTCIQTFELRSKIFQKTFWFGNKSFVQTFGFKVRLVFRHFSFEARFFRDILVSKKKFCSCIWSQRKTFVTSWFRSNYFVHTFYYYKQFFFSKSRRLQLSKQLVSKNDFVVKHFWLKSKSFVCVLYCVSFLF